VLDTFDAILGIWSPASMKKNQWGTPQLTLSVTDFKQVAVSASVPVTNEMPRAAPAIDANSSDVTLFLTGGTPARRIQEKRYDQFKVEIRISIGDCARDCKRGGGCAREM